MPEYTRGSSRVGIETPDEVFGRDTLSAYSTETIEVVRDYLDDLADAGEDYRQGRQACAELVAEACESIQPRERCLARSLSRCQEIFGLDEASRPPTPEVYFIHARLELVDDVETREKLLNLPTDPATSRRHSTTARRRSGAHPRGFARLSAALARPGRGSRIRERPHAAEPEVGALDRAPPHISWSLRWRSQ